MLEARIDYFRSRLIKWFSTNRRKFPWRKKSNSNYRNIIAEVLLQRTRAENVAIFYNKFIEKFPTWKSISLASEKEIGQFLRPIGIWRRRADSLKRLADEMVKTNGRFPQERKEIEELPGVGQYIANAVLLFCHSEPQPLIDANMARVIERFFGPRKLVDIRYDPYLQDLAARIVSSGDPIATNWAILDLAALVCKPRNPKCAICPLTIECRFYKSDIVVTANCHYISP